MRRRGRGIGVDGQDGTLGRMAGPKRIAVLYQGGDPTMDLLVMGIEDHRRAHPGWILRHQYGPPADRASLEEFVAWRPDGLLTAMSLPPALLTLGLPVVTLRHAQSPHAVLSDDRKVGAAAAAYLAGLGSASIACLLPERTMSASGWTALRPAGFHEEIARRGLQAATVHWQTHAGVPAVAEHILGQLRQLPRPCAIFTGNDHLALELEEMALANGLRIPADLAILGADDAPRCATVQIPLSTVRVAHRSIGRRGAGMLAGLLDGTIRGPLVEALPPEGIAERASTDAVEVADPEVAAVLAFIRAHASEPFSVDDAVSASTLGRRSIEQRFRALLGRTILAEIQAARVRRSCVLLADQRRSIADVAMACGFNDQQHFATVFRKLIGEAPSAWRRREAQQARPPAP